MPAISKLNKIRSIWTDYDWSRSGDEWSDRWGGPAAQWHGTILPRIASFLPTDHLLEIAPGFGRVTEHLLPLCARYTGVDITPHCIEGCRERFDGAAHARFESNDGFSLSMIGDADVSFAFSFDSLVHAGQDVIAGYALELARVLEPGACAFIHHSNLGAHADGGLPEPTRSRHATVSAESAATAFADAGLQIAAQELITWGTPFLLDCFTLACKPAPGENTTHKTRRLENTDFDEEVKRVRRVASLYNPEHTEPSAPDNTRRS